MRWPPPRSSPDTSCTGTRTRRSTSCPCPRIGRASSSGRGTSTVRSACCPTAASWVATTPPCRTSTTAVGRSPTSNRLTARSSTGPTGRSAGRPCTSRARTRCGARRSAGTRRRAPTGSSTTTRPTPAARWTAGTMCSEPTSPRRRARSPPPSSGRLVEWFAPSYKSYCIVYGPTTGGVGPHHVDGTGGLAQPGTMAVASNDDLLVPNVGTSSVLRFAHAVAAHQRRPVPGRGVPARQGAGLDVRQGPVLPRWHRRGPDLRLLRHQQLHRRSLHRLGERKRQPGTGAGLGARHDGGRPRPER